MINLLHLFSINKIAIRIDSHVSFNDFLVYKFNIWTFFFNQITSVTRRKLDFLIDFLISKEKSNFKVKLDLKYSLFVSQIYA